MKRSLLARRIALVALSCVATPAAAAAQRREPVLAQVNVPHGYYWREMYVPQVTSGPSSFTWSPDGHEVIYSMQGSLWRQRLGTTTATQLTSGETYDFQPDWSPDGRSVVYSAYDGRSLALMLLDLPTGETRALIDDGSVNVDARWSPDGSRVAWVSTAFRGRWHVFVARFASARIDSVTRITEDHDSGLPRYYYSAFDHYLSPTWSPDGRELIVVSNRGHIYGTGGLWRMEARAGAPMRELHFEETAWRAHPDWARDGKRVVYSGYQGGQWHQLWLMRGDPSTPMQLTYGDFDATSPRWSPDMSRIGYISNASGNTSLWTVTVPGGKRERVDVRTRRYREPAGRVVITVLDSAARRPTIIPVRLSLRDSAGRYFAPDGRWRHSDEAVVRDRQRFEYGYWHSSGADTLWVPPGTYVLEAWRGPEWHTRAVSLRVVAGRTAVARVALARLANLPARGWWSGDLHVHMNYGGTYRNTPARLAFQARAEGLNVVENLVVNKEQRIPDIATWRPGTLYAARDVLIANGQEFHTVFWGHTAQLGLRDHLLLPDYAGYPGTALASLYPTNAAVFDLAHEQGALTGSVHPFDFDPDLSVIQAGVPYELPIDVALGKVDYIEVMGYSDHLVTSSIWYKLLNCGFRVPAAGGTDAFPNYAQMRGPPGLVRTYANAGATLDHGRWLRAIKAGRTFVTNAPLLSFTIEGREPGGDVRLPAGRRRLRARVTLQSAVPVDHLEIVGNGRVVARLRPVRDTTVTLPVERSGWYLARAYGSAPRPPVLDLYPFATTSPVYVSLGGGRAAPSCGADAEYFLRWIDLVGQRVRADTNWNTASERDSALAAISRAHEEFIRRR